MLVNAADCKFRSAAHWPRCGTCVVRLFCCVLVLVATLSATPADCLRENSTVSTALFHTVERPAYLAVEPQAGTVLISDQLMHNVYRLHLNGTVALVAGGSTSGFVDGTGTSARFASPWGIAVHSSGTIYVCDTLNHAVRSVDGRVVATVAGTGVAGHVDTPVPQFNEPRGITWNRLQNVLYIADSQNNRIRQINLYTHSLSTYAGFAVGSTTDVFRTSAKFNEPSDVAYDAIHRVLYIADTGNGHLRSVDSNGIVSTLVGDAEASHSYNGEDGSGSSVTLSGPRGIALSPDGSIVYIADTSACAVRYYTVDDSWLGTLAGRRCDHSAVDGTAAVATFRAPHSIAYFPNITLQLHPTLLVADANSSRVRRVSIPVATETISMTPEAPSMSASASVRQDIPATPSATSLRLSPSGGTTTHTMGSISGAFTGSASSVSMSVAATASHVASMSSTDAHQSLSTSPGAATTSSSVHASRSMAVTSSASSTAQRSLSRSFPVSLTRIVSPTRSIVLSSSLVHSESASRSRWDCSSRLDHSIVSLVSVVEGTSPPSFQEHPSLVLLPTEAVFATNAQGTGRRNYNGSTELPLLAAPLPRVPLLTRTGGLFPSLHLNVSVLQPTAAQRWRVARVSLANDHNLLFEALTRNTEGHHDLILRPPANATLGWLPDDTFLYRTTELLLSLDFECDGSPIGTLRVAIPSPGAPVPLSEEVKTATRVAQWVSVLSGSGAGSSVGRVAAIRSMALCGSGGASGGGGLLGLAIPSSSSQDASCAHNDNEERRELVEYARGAVVGNTALVAGGFVLMGICSVVLARFARWRLLFASRRLAIPSTLFPLWIVVIPSTAGATALLAVASVSEGCVSDVGLVILGAALCIGPLALCAALVVVFVPRLGLSAQRAARGPNAPPEGSTCRKRVSHMITIVTRRRARWSSQENTKKTPSDSKDGHPERHAWVLLIEFTRLWYAPLDALVLLLAGALAAVSGLGSISSMSLCYGTVGTILFLYLAELIVCAVCLPLTTLFASVHAMMTLALSCGSVAFQLAYYAVVSSSGSSSNLDESAWLMEASAVCDLLVVGITMVRIATDFYEVLKSIRSIVAASALHRAATMTKAGDPSSARSGMASEEDDAEVERITKASSAQVKEAKLSMISTHGGAPPPPLRDWAVNEHSSGSDVDDILRRPAARQTQQQDDARRGSSWSADVGADPLDSLFWDDNGKAVKRKFTMLDFNDSNAASDDGHGGDDAPATTILIEAPTR